MRNGKHIGRPRKLTDDQAAEALALIESDVDTRASAAAKLGIDVGTLRRALSRRLPGKMQLPQ